VAYRRGSTVVTMGPARDCAHGDTSVYLGSGPSRVEVKPLLPACFILSYTVAIIVLLELFGLEEEEEDRISPD
jgi:hypothetical protein